MNGAKQRNVHGNVMGTIDSQLNREDRTGKLVRIQDGDWVNVSSAISLHKMMETSVRGSPEGTDREEPLVNEQGTLRLSEAFEQVDRTSELIFESQFEDLRFGDTADDVFDGGIKKGSNLLIRVVPENQDLDDSWHRVARTWINQTEGLPTNLTFDKFSVQSINEPDQERYQIVQTFGGDFVYGFGRQPRIMMLTGNVLNGKMKVRVGEGETRSMDWKNALQRNYDDHYRLTRCIHNRQKILIYAEHTIYAGYLLNMQTFTSAETQSMSQVTMSFIIQKKHFARNNDDEIPGRLNEAGRTVSDKTVPEEYLKDAKKEDYIEEHLVPLVKKQTDSGRQKVSRLLDDLTNLTGGPRSALKERSENVNVEDYHKPFPKTEVHRLFDSERIGFPDLKFIKEERKRINLAMFRFARKYGKGQPSSDFGKVVENISNFLVRNSEKVQSITVFTEAYQNALTEAALGNPEAKERHKEIQGMKNSLIKLEESLAKKIKKANNLAEKLVASQKTTQTNEQYINALTGT